MNLKRSSTISLLLLLVTLIALPMLTTGASPAYGPKTDNLLIRIYTNPDAEYMALDTGTIDIVDWPLLKDWYTKWLGDPNVQMRSYAEMAYNELTPNHQRWPTGWRNTGAFIPDRYNGTPGDPRYEDARQMRLAIARLDDKPRYVSEILKGFGYESPVPWPYPAFGGWVDLAALAAAGWWPPEQDIAQAQIHLAKGGFKNLDTSDAWLEYDVNKNGVWDPGIDETLYEDAARTKPMLIFYSRADDPERGGAADLLYAAMTNVGIPVDYRKRDFYECYLNVMLGDAEGKKPFNLYTSGWIATAPTMDGLYDQYSSAGIVEVEGQFSWNYGGFFVGDGIEGTADDAYDYELWSSRVKYITSWHAGFPSNFEAVRTAIIECSVIAANFVNTMPWWSKKAVKAYRTGWDGTVNHVALGVDFAASHRFAWLDMDHATDNTIDWGFKANPATLNPVTQEWLWEANVVGNIYEELIRHNPFDVARHTPWLAAPIGTGPDGHYGTEDPVNHPEYGFDDILYEEGEWAGGAWLKWKFRDDAYFHDGTLVMPEDYRWTIMFQLDCGPGISFDWTTIQFVDHIDTQAQDAGLGPREVKVYFSVKSYWTVFWSGYFEVMNKDLWELAERGPDKVDGTADDWDYDFSTNTPGPNWDPLKVKAYHGWEFDSDNDGKTDLEEDGTGPWIFKSFVPGQTIALAANTNFYKSQEECTAYVTESFRRAGDTQTAPGSVTYSGEVDIDDLAAIQKAIPYTGDPTDPPLELPLDWNVYNSGADLDRSGKVDEDDMFAAGRNYGAVKG